MTKHIGILTAGGDSPGLNAAIRGVGKAGHSHYGMHIIGFRDSFRGLLENRTRRLESDSLSVILTLGGTPSAADRLLATRLGTACAEYIQQGIGGVMVAARGEGADAIPLEQVAGNKKLIPPDHPWVESARRVGTNLGD